MNLRLRNAAEADVDDAVAWYRERSRELGDRFLEALDECLILVQQTRRITTACTGRRARLHKMNQDLLQSDGTQATAGRKIRLAAAFAVAAISDFLSAWLEFLPPLQWSLDLVTAGLLFVILGRQWMILPGLIAEAIPGVAVFPFWVVVVLSIAAWGKVGPSIQRPPRS